MKESSSRLISTSVIKNSTYYHSLCHGCSKNFNKFASLKMIMIFETLAINIPPFCARIIKLLCTSALRSWPAQDYETIFLYSGRVSTKPGTTVCSIIFTIRSRKNVPAGLKQLSPKILCGASQ